jgi:hypothetical protein
LCVQHQGATYGLNGLLAKAYVSDSNQIMVEYWSVYGDFSPTMYIWRQGRSVGIATRYSLDGLVIESRWGGGRNLPHPSRPATVGPPSLLYNE